MKSISLVTLVMSITVVAGAATGASKITPIGIFCDRPREYSCNLACSGRVNLRPHAYGCSQTKWSADFSPVLTTATITCFIVDQTTKLQVL
ncbi:uncharacterized protein EDB91DRAFT_78343 [Suillus paluster]|uniref:uncharacterized protein n=1 Tax=Suillus paluster TaxID=48578 RepID=UPI001B874DAE|nr:uncharacterized protein EDB91DRAFT_78343 [Suillus paluster]KAG1726012.1 hypothetical protein EDB91DRAFT_78343 [Suillus paluster]